MAGLTLELEIGAQAVVSVPIWEPTGYNEDGEATYSLATEEIVVTAQRVRTGRIVLTIAAPKRYTIRREKAL
jgi:hypothetical protein